MDTLTHSCGNCVVAICESHTDLLRGINGPAICSWVYISEAASYLSTTKHVLCFACPSFSAWSTFTHPMRLNSSLILQKPRLHPLYLLHPLHSLHSLYPYLLHPPPPVSDSLPLLHASIPVLAAYTLYICSCFRCHLRLSLGWSSL